MKDYNESVEGNYDAQGVTLEDQHGEVREYDADEAAHDHEERIAEAVGRFDYNPLEV